MSIIDRALHWLGIFVRCFKFGYISGNNYISLRATIRHPQSLTIGRGARIREYVYVLGHSSGAITIGERSNVGPFVMLEAQENGFITIGKECGINPFGMIYGAGGVTIGDYTRIAAHVVIVSSNHGFDDVTRNIKDQESIARGVIIGSDVWIGTGARILDGVRIGDHAVIGAGAVVTKDIPEYAVAVGVPAKVLRYRGEQPTV